MIQQFQPTYALPYVLKSRDQSDEYIKPVPENIVLAARVNNFFSNVEPEPSKLTTTERKTATADSKETKQQVELKNKEQAANCSAELTPKEQTLPTEEHPNYKDHLIAKEELQEAYLKVENICKDNKENATEKLELKPR